MIDNNNYENLHRDLIAENDKLKQENAHYIQEEIALRDSLKELFVNNSNLKNEITNLNNLLKRATDTSKIGYDKLNNAELKITQLKEDLYVSGLDNENYEHAIKIRNYEIAQLKSDEKKWLKLLEWKDKRWAALKDWCEAYWNRVADHMTVMEREALES